VGWSRVTDEQTLFDEVRLSGALPDVAATDGLAVIVTNAAANKLDVDLERSIDYRATVADDGTLTGTVEITVRNTAPAEGLPDGVLGNYTGEPPGTNRMLLTIGSAMVVSDLRVDGEEVQQAAGREAGWQLLDVFLSVAPGAERTITAEILGTVPTDRYALALRPHPLVAPERLAVDVRRADGTALVAFDGVSAERTVLEAAPDRSG
jgi:hypothetical protein